MPTIGDRQLCNNSNISRNNNNTQWNQEAKQLVVCGALCSAASFLFQNICSKEPASQRPNSGGDSSTHCVWNQDRKERRVQKIPFLCENFTALWQICEKCKLVDFIATQISMSVSSRLKPNLDSLCPSDIQRYWLPLNKGMSICPLSSRTFDQPDERSQNMTK